MSKTKDKIRMFLSVHTPLWLNDNCRAVLIALIIAVLLAALAYSPVAALIFK